MNASSESGLCALTISLGVCSGIRRWVGIAQYLTALALGIWNRACGYAGRIHWGMTRRELIALSPALLLTSCSTGPVPPAQPEKPAVPLTGLHALYQLYTSARAWAQDLQILRYSSINIAEVPHQDGKVAAWQVVFVSQALAKLRTYTFSAYEASATLHKGIFEDAPQDWPGGGKTFLLESVKIDTDKAWETALAHGREYNSKNPKTPISYTLRINKGNVPSWRVMWGESAGESSFSVLVDGTTGDFMQIVN